MDPTDNSSQGGSDGDQGQERRFSNEDVSRMISDRINQQNVAHKAEMDSLRSELSKPEVKVYTRQEINAAITSGNITEAAGQEIFDKQQSRQTELVAQNIARQTVESMTQTNTIQAKIDKYMAFDPSLSTPGSAARNRVEAKIQNQMQNLGQTQPTLGTELTALDAIYGSVDSLGGSRERQSHQEIPGSQDLQVNQDGAPEMTKRERDFYQSRMDQGAYPGGWDDVAAELKHANPDVRRRAAAR